jgi:hypothetical protein
MSEFRDVAESDPPCDARLLAACARELVATHGADAPEVARHWAEAASFDGDGQGVRIWRLVAARAVRLLHEPH